MLIRGRTNHELRRRERVVVMRHARYLFSTTMSTVRKRNELSEDASETYLPIGLGCGFVLSFQHIDNHRL